jgi:GNAT superfamily N-acetyltransferase
MTTAVVEGTVPYREFAGADWAGLNYAEEIVHVRADIADPDVWCLVAEDDGLAGQVTILPAANAGRPVDEPDLAHFRNLFVRRDHWGTGLARELHARAVAEARRRGFREMRLFAAAGQARARRFYEREGWVQRGEPVYDPAPDLVMVEYRLPLVS